ncbi:MAG TPA: protein tyrosine phosphatase family protein [Anaerolineales bacterium]|nr:protein tyrosine phosphatase family protein [Anaerolineales bacterium]
MPTTAIYNVITVNDAVLTGGQPTAEQLEAVAAEGYTAVINLAPYDPTRSLADEAGLARSLGLAYDHIPVDWADPTDADFAAFEQIMLRRAGAKILIHCMANFRATAFYSLFAQKHLGWSQAQAEALRDVIWKGSDYPVWRAFIARVQARLLEP